MKLLLATENTGKIAEMKPLLESIGIEVETLLDYPDVDQDPELGEDIEANSKAKARSAYETTQQNVLADDSGLFFEGLNGKPGVNTKGWIGRHGDDPVSFESFLREEFKNVSDRSGTFMTVMNLVLRDRPDEIHQFTDKVAGTLTLEGWGEFIPGLALSRHFIPDGQTKTLAEMDKEEEARYSHRSLALKKVMEMLQNNECEGEVKAQR